MANNEGDKKTVKVGGEKYTLQNPGVRWYIKHTDQCKGTQGNLSNEKYMDGLLEMVVIQDVDMDDFENVGDLKDLVDEIEKFLGAK